MFAACPMRCGAVLPEKIKALRLCSLLYHGKDRTCECRGLSVVEAVVEAFLSIGKF